MTQTIEVGELLFEATLQTTSTEGFGITSEAISGGDAMPPAGARFDVAIEGTSIGKIAGRVKAVDYFLMRPDGRGQMHVHGSMETPDGARIAFSASGTSSPNEASGLFELRMNVDLHTASPEFAWLNTISIWGNGTLDMATGQLNIKGYAA